MSRKTIRISERTHDMLKRLQIVDKRPLQEILEAAVDEVYQKRESEIKKALPVK